MGRRSINTTKSGKYMNPTDQARKEARKKELKKNKRQRQMVRAAVLKNKDPSQILEEMEKIDEMEYNVLQPSPLNEKVLRDKRKKLKETFDRVMRLYHNDEPDHWSELKRKEVDYEKKRLKKQQYYESVKHAQSVQVDEIPLPAPVTTPVTGASTATTSTNSSFTSTIRVPPPPMTMSLPPFAPGAPPGVVKNSEANDMPADKAIKSDDKDWLGVPPGPPPDLFSFRELDSDAEGNTDYDEDDKETSKRSPKRRSPSKNEPSHLQQRTLAMSGQNIDDFMKEMEHVHKRKHRKLLSDDEDEHMSDNGKKEVSGKLDADQKHKDKSPTRCRNHSDSQSSSNDGQEDDDDDDEENDDDLDDIVNEVPAKKSVVLAFGSADLPKLTPKESPLAALPTLPPMPLPPALLGATLPSGIPAPPQMPHTAPGLPHLHGVAPPPSMLFRPPPLRPPGPGLPAFGIRMPPGPPPGARPPHALAAMPRLGIRLPPGPPPGLPPRLPSHLKHVHPSALPPKEVVKGVTTITAKPQIRNLSADVTRFVPSTLRVRREDHRKPTRPKHLSDAAERALHMQNDGHKAPTKDDAYLQFMNEMQGLL